MAPFESGLQLRDEHDVTILYITHDLATAAYLTDRVAVMYHAGGSVLKRPSGWFLQRDSV